MFSSLRFSFSLKNINVLRCFRTTAVAKVRLLQKNYFLISICVLSYSKIIFEIRYIYWRNIIMSDKT